MRRLGTRRLYENYNNFPAAKGPLLAIRTTKSRSQSHEDFKVPLKKYKPPVVVHFSIRFVLAICIDDLVFIQAQTTESWLEERSYHAWLLCCDCGEHNFKFWPIIERLHGRSEYGPESKANYSSISPHCSRHCWKLINVGGRGPRLADR